MGLNSRIFFTTLELLRLKSLVVWTVWNPNCAHTFHLITPPVPQCYLISPASSDVNNRRRLHFNHIRSSVFFRSIILVIKLGKMWNLQVVTSENSMCKQWKVEYIEYKGNSFFSLSLCFSFHFLVMYRRMMICVYELSIYWQEVISLQ